MTHAAHSSRFALWFGVTLCVLGLSLIGWVLSSLNDLHTKLSAISPKAASVLVAAVLLVLLVILLLGVRLLWTLGRSDSAPEPAVAADPQIAAAQSLAAGERQIALVEDEIARRGLSTELSNIADDLAAKRYTIVVFGTGSAGKTSVINALLGRAAGQTDPVTGTTKDGEAHEYAIDGFEDGSLRLIDTPGLSEIGPGGAMREDRARELATQADLLIFVVDQDLRDIEYRPLASLARLGKRGILVLSKRDLYSHDDAEAIMARLRGRVAAFIPSDCVLSCAAAPGRLVVRDSSGSHSETPSPDVADLADRIAQTLRGEGRDLLAANVLLRAKQVSDKARETIHTARTQRCRTIVRKFTWTTAGVMFVNPVPGLGPLAAAAINYQMVCELAQVFGITIGAAAAKRMARELAEVMIKIGVVGLVTELLSKALKATLVAYAAGGAIEAVVGAYLTRLGGDAFVEYFARNQNWGDGGMQGAIERRFELLKRGEFVAAFLREAADRVLQPAPRGVDSDSHPERGS